MLAETSSRRSIWQLELAPLLCRLNKLCCGLTIQQRMLLATENKLYFSRLPPRFSANRTVYALFRAIHGNTELLAAIGRTRHSET